MKQNLYKQALFLIEASHLLLRRWINQIRSNFDLYWNSKQSSIKTNKQTKKKLPKLILIFVTKGDQINSQFFVRFSKEFNTYRSLSLWKLECILELLVKYVYPINYEKNKTKQKKNHAITPTNLIFLNNSRKKNILIYLFIFF